MEQGQLAGVEFFLLEENGTRHDNFQDSNLIIPLIFRFFWRFIFYLDILGAYTLI